MVFSTKISTNSERHIESAKKKLKANVLREKADQTFSKIPVMENTLCCGRICRKGMKRKTSFHVCALAAQFNKCVVSRAQFLAYMRKEPSKTLFCCFLMKTHAHDTMKDNFFLINTMS